MSNELQKRSYEDHIRFLLLRYPNNLKRVAEEASKYFDQEISTVEIGRILQKFTKQQNRDVNLWVACNLAKEILLGAQQRAAKLEAMFQTWAGKEESLRSLCCKAPVSEHILSGNHYYRCLKCDTTCNVESTNHLELEGLKITLIQEMREESLHLIQFAEKMGFTAQPPAPVTKNQNFILVDNRKAEGKEAVPIDAEMGRQIENVHPMEREHIIKRLEGLLPDIETEVEFAEPVKNEGDDGKATQ